MSRLRNFVAKMPYLAECKSADRFSTRNLMIVDLELSKEDSIYSYRDTDAEEDRVSVLDIPDNCVVNKEVYEASKKRLRICVLACDKVKGRITESQEKELELLILDAKENFVPEVEEAMPLDVAVSGVWS